MALHWQLNQVLKTRGICTASQLQRLLEDQLGVNISRQALAKLLKKTPQTLRLDTAQMLCTVLQVSLADLLVMTPEPVIKQPGTVVKPYVRKKKTQPFLMADPGDFF
jgi:DNA-binding Xre family transcriptional regulator